MSKYAEQEQMELAIKKNNCNICNASIQKNKTKEFEYIGVVCSACFRMSKKRYCKLVDTITEMKIKFIMNEIENYKVGDNPNPP
mgnify:FL=1|tara:strand:- start:454 stop:705 length:252 start_codon:yes stop_codon:yes gene_type:complete